MKYFNYNTLLSFIVNESAKNLKNKVTEKLDATTNRSVMHSNSELTITGRDNEMSNCETSHSSCQESLGKQAVKSATTNITSRRRILRQVSKTENNDNIEIVETIKSLDSKVAECDNFEVQQQSQLTETEFKPSRSKGISLKRILQ